MSVLVTTGAQLMCSFGTTPSCLSAQTMCMGAGKPIATVADVQPGVNIPPFGMCTSLANPAVAAATAAALGVLTPQPCTLVPAGTWIPTKPSVIIGGKPCLCNDSSLMCGCGAGTIKIVSPGQMKIIIS